MIPSDQKSIWSMYAGFLASGKVRASIIVPIRISIRAKSAYSMIGGVICIKKISREVYRFSGDLQLSARTGREDSEIHQSRNRYKSLTSCIIHFPSTSPIGFKTIFSPTKCYHFCVSSINIIWIRSVFCLGGGGRVPSDLLLRRVNTVLSWDLGILGSDILFL